MKITIDTEELTIEVHGELIVSELEALLGKLPGSYKLIPTKEIVEVRKYFPYVPQPVVPYIPKIPFAPYNPYPCNPLQTPYWITCKTGAGTNNGFNNAHTITLAVKPYIAG